MSLAEDNPIGQIEWFDLTVDNADEVRDFYAAVVGWESSSVSMGDYKDYNMTQAGTETPVAGICHARGMNAALPPVWLVYITVADFDHAMEMCREQDGEILAGPYSIPDYGRYCIIRDPAGAASALFEKANKSET